jgi:hypothetical protein
MCCTIGNPAIGCRTFGRLDFIRDPLPAAQNDPPPILLQDCFSGISDFFAALAKF